MRTAQSRSELEQQLIEQIQFLRTSAERYDSGIKAEAKRMAVALRILLHDTSNSTSLLCALGEKEAIQYYDSIEEIDSEKTISFLGVRITVTRDGATFVPRLTVPPKKVTFDEWWNRIVIFTPAENIEFTRKDIILSLANTDGGAHVDPELERDYWALSRMKITGWNVRTQDGAGIVEHGPELALVRESAHEIVMSLVEHFSFLS
jgi:hypothetical protein